jgi:hypothetical protein
VSLPKRHTSKLTGLSLIKGRVGGMVDAMTWQAIAINNIRCHRLECVDCAKHAGNSKYKGRNLNRHGGSNPPPDKYGVTMIDEKILINYILHARYESEKKQKKAKIGIDAEYQIARITNYTEILNYIEKITKNDEVGNG